MRGIIYSKYNIIKVHVFSLYVQLFNILCKNVNTLIHLIYNYNSLKLYYVYNYSISYNSNK